MFGKPLIRQTAYIKQILCFTKVSKVSKGVRARLLGFLSPQAKLREDRTLQPTRSASA